jgi:hypothetical protein
MCNVKFIYSELQMVEDGTTLNGVLEVDSARHIKGNFEKQLWQLSVSTKFVLCYNKLLVFVSND